MKKMLLVVSMILVAGVVLAAFTSYQPLAVTVYTTSRTVVPSVYVTNASSWATGTFYATNAVITNSSKLAYWAVVGGTTANPAAPTHSDGDATDGGVTWRYIRTVRDHLVLQNQGSGNVWFAFGRDAVVGKGIKLTPGSTMTLTDNADAPKCAVNAISDASTNSIGVQED